MADLEQVINETIENEMSHKRYVVTSAQYCAQPHKEFMETLEHYCEVNDAELLILPLQGRHYLEDTLHDDLRSLQIVRGSKHLNRKIQTIRYNILPQQIDPSTGLARFTQNDVSTIIASPKQRLKVVPNSNTELPKILVSTGAITRPRYMDNRRGHIAERDHRYGALVVEIEDDIHYHLRHLTATNNGSFVDLCVKYDGKKKPRKTKPEALVLGDYHLGDTDEEVRKIVFNMIDRYRPKRIILHDFFNGHSVNHHDAGKLVYRAQDNYNSRLSLEDELKRCVEELKDMARASDHKSEIVIVSSNHHEFLDRYLQEGRFMYDPQNTYLGAKLFALMIEGKNPLQEGLKLVGRLPKGVRFLERNEDYKVRGWQLGSHGDCGPRGSRSNGVNSREQAHGKSITGHSHEPQILRDTYVVGTLTPLFLRYTKGASSWMNTSAFLYDNGKAQLVNIIQGKYCLPN